MSDYMSAVLTVDDIYPVGSIYMSVNDTDPARLFGGMWERIKERFLLGAGDTHTAGSTGGEFEHRLKLNEIPEHNHYALYGGGSGSQYGFSIVENSISGQFEKYAIQNAGGSQPHNNTPPYLAVYIWRRIA